MSEITYEDYKSNGFSVERREILTMVSPKRAERFIIDETSQSSRFVDSTIAASANPKTFFRLSDPWDPETTTPEVLINGKPLSPVEVIQGVIDTIHVLDGGAGYISNKIIDRIDVTDVGTGYELKSERVEVIVTPAPIDVGTVDQELKARAIVDGTGGVKKIIVTQKGIGYTQLPQITVRNRQSLAESPATLVFTLSAGAIESVKVVDGGKGYSDFNLIDISLAKNGANTSAIDPKLNFNVNELGEITSVDVIDGGSGWITPLAQSEVSLDNTVYPQANSPALSSIEIKTESVPYRFELPEEDRNLKVSYPVLDITITDGRVADINVIERGTGFRKEPRVIIENIDGTQPTKQCSIKSYVSDVPLRKQRANEYLWNSSTNTITLFNGDGSDFLFGVTEQNFKNTNLIPNGRGSSELSVNAAGNDYVRDNNNDVVLPEGLGLRTGDEITIEYYVDTHKDNANDYPDSFLQQLAHDLTIHPYDDTLDPAFSLIYPNKPIIKDNHEENIVNIKSSIKTITNVFVVESEIGVDLLSSSKLITPDSDFMPSISDQSTLSRTPQKWRIRFEYDTQLGQVSVNIGTKYQIQDDGTISQQRGAVGARTYIARTPGELCEVYTTNTTSSSTKSKSGFFIRSTRDDIPKQGTYPITYRLTVTDHGMVFYMFEQTEIDSDTNHAWFVVQRHVDNVTGKFEMEDGYSPVHCLYSASKIPEEYSQPILYDEFKWYDIEVATQGTYNVTSNTFQAPEYKMAERKVSKAVTSLSTGSKDMSMFIPTVMEYTIGSEKDIFLPSRSGSHTIFDAVRPNTNAAKSELAAHLNGLYAVSLLKVPRIVGYTQQDNTIFNMGQSIADEVLSFDGRYAKAMAALELKNDLKTVTLDSATVGIKNTYKSKLNNLLSDINDYIGDVEAFRDSNAISLTTEVSYTAEKAGSTTTYNIKGYVFKYWGDQPYLTDLVNDAASNSNIWSNLNSHSFLYDSNATFNFSTYNSVTGQSDTGYDLGYQLYGDGIKEVFWDSGTSAAEVFDIDGAVISVIKQIISAYKTHYVDSNGNPYTAHDPVNTGYSFFATVGSRSGPTVTPQSDALINESVVIDLNDSSLHSDIQALIPTYQNALNNVINKLTQWKQMIENYIVETEESIKYITNEIDKIDNGLYDEITVVDLQPVSTLTVSLVKQVSLNEKQAQYVTGDTSGVYENISETLVDRPTNLGQFFVFVNGQSIRGAVIEKDFTIDSTPAGYSTYINEVPNWKPATSTAQQYFFSEKDDRIWFRYPLSEGDKVVVKYYTNTSSGETILVQRISDDEVPSSEELFRTKQIYRFVVREKDILSPTPIHWSATMHQTDSSAIMNPMDQIAITSDRSFVFQFPGPISSKRYFYPNSELDLVCYSSAEISAHTSIIRVGTDESPKFSHDTAAWEENGMNYRAPYTWNTESDGSKKPRLYQGMLSTLPNGNGMRLFTLVKNGPVVSEYTDVIDSESSFLN